MSEPVPACIFLIGYRGSGKSRVAKLVAERLGWQWLDADELLADRAGRSIREIFAAEGETGFRNREAELLAELCRLERHVIATGGGVILRQENRARLRQGLVVWLTAEPATLWRRIAGDAASAAQRPDLAGGGLAEVEELLAARLPHYRDCAHFIVDTENRTPEMSAEHIVDLVRSTLPGSNPGQ
jgi:shikimate kinase